MNCCELTFSPESTELLSDRAKKSQNKSFVAKCVQAIAHNAAKIAIPTAGLPGATVGLMAGGMAAYADISGIPTAGVDVLVPFLAVSAACLSVSAASYSFLHRDDTEAKKVFESANIGINGTTYLARFDKENKITVHGPSRYICDEIRFIIEDSLSGPSIVNEVSAEKRQAQFKNQLEELASDLKKAGDDARNKTWKTNSR